MLACRRSTDPASIAHFRFTSIASCPVLTSASVKVSAILIRMSLADFPMADRNSIGGRILRSAGERSRLPGSRTTSGRLPLLLEEFGHVFARSWSRILGRSFQLTRYSTKMEKPAVLPHPPVRRLPPILRVSISPNPHKSSSAVKGSDTAISPGSSTRTSASSKSFSKGSTTSMLFSRKCRKVVL